MQVAVFAYFAAGVARLGTDATNVGSCERRGDERGRGKHSDDESEVDEFASLCE